MSSIAADTVAPAASSRPMLDRKPGRFTILLFLVLLVLGVGYSGFSLVSDISSAAPRGIALLPTCCWVSHCSSRSASSSSTASTIPPMPWRR